jgi:hypothetical protein
MFVEIRPVEREEPGEAEVRNAIRTAQEIL